MSCSKLSLSGLLILPLLLVGCPSDSVPVVEGVEVTLDDSNFTTQILQSESPVLVEFGAVWCGPCREMEPMLSYLSVQYRDRLTVGKLDVDQNVQVAQEYSVNALPTLVLFDGGEEQARVEGWMSYEELSGWIDTYLAESVRSQPAAGAAAPDPTAGAEPVAE